jgi:hypothetical protein
MTFFGAKDVSFVRCDRIERSGMTPNGNGPLLSAELLGILAVAHPNVLLIGPRAATARAMDRLRDHVRLPIGSWSPREARALPNEDRGTLLIPEIDTADGEQQSQLCTWIEARTGLVHILAISVTPLFRWSRSGCFLSGFTTG